MREAEPRRRRTKLLQHDPQIGPVDMATLAGVAVAIERAAAQRYATLAEHMSACGEAATAAAFRDLHDEAEQHAAAAEARAASLGGVVGQGASAVPVELGDAWDELSGSALLSPYRAFAVAVDNRQRAFAFYSYLAAQAASEVVRLEAERLADAELGRAAALRRQRRLAWRGEPHVSAADAAATVHDLAGLDALLARSWAGIAACHRAVGQRLREIGADDRAGALDGLLVDLAPGPLLSQDVVPAATELAAIHAATTPRALLMIAQRPLERLAEELEALLAISEGALFDAAAAAVDVVVVGLARMASSHPAQP